MAASVEGDLGNKSEMIPEQHACKILITCALPTRDGKMDVKMTYEGDPALASYLLEHAQSYIEHEDEPNFC